MKRIQETAKELGARIPILLALGLLLLCVSSLSAAPIDLSTGWEVRYIWDPVDDVNDDVWVPWSPNDPNDNPEDFTDYLLTLVGTPSVTLTGPDGFTITPQNGAAILWSKLFLVNTTIDFFWSYTTEDFEMPEPDQYVIYDYAGFFLGEVPANNPFATNVAGEWQRLALDDGPPNQSGFRSLFIPANTRLNFYVLSSDLLFSPGELTISSPAGAIPEPGALGLFTIGLVALLGARTLRRHARSGNTN